MHSINRSEWGISIALVVFNEEERIGKALASLVPIGDGLEAEILVVDNGSTDGTRRAVMRFMDLYPELELRWLSHSPNNLGASRAYAAREARHEVIAFLDADCEAPPGWAERSFHALLSREFDPSVLAVGSGNFPPSDQNVFNQALALQLSSPLGHMNTSQARLLSIPREVPHLPTCNVSYFRRRLLDIGNFSPDFPKVCEDLELSIRARKRGFKLLYEPGLEVKHSQRPSWQGWARKMFRYGRGQIDVARVHPGHIAGIKALPLLAIMLSLIGLFTSPVSFAFFFLLYLGITGIYSATISILGRRPRLTARVFGLFVITHFFYGAGEVWGLLRQIENQKVYQGKRK